MVFEAMPVDAEPDISPALGVGMPVMGMMQMQSGVNLGNSASQISQSQSQVQSQVQPQSLPSLIPPVPTPLEQNSSSAAAQ